MTDKVCELFFDINLLSCKLVLGVLLAAAEFLSLMSNNDVCMERWLNFSTEFNLHQAWIGLFEFPGAFLTLRQWYQWYSCRNNENKLESHWSSQLPSLHHLPSFFHPCLFYTAQHCSERCEPLSLQPCIAGPRPSPTDTQPPARPLLVISLGRYRKAVRAGTSLSPCFPPTPLPKPDSPVSLHHHRHHPPPPSTDTQRIKTCCKNRPIVQFRHYYVNYKYTQCSS